MLKFHPFKPLLSALCFSSLLLSGYGCTQSEPSAAVIVEQPIADTSESTEFTAKALANEKKIAPPEASTSSDSNASPNEAISAAEQRIDERLELANIKEPQAAKDFLEEMRKGAIAQDESAIASLIHYPFTTYDSGNPIKTYASPTELLPDFTQVVTPTVLKTMAEAQYKDIFVNSQGAMIGDGEVWFLDYGEGIKIKSINGQ